MKHIDKSWIAMLLGVLLSLPLPGQNRSPEALGIHPARLSDQAQIELLLRQFDIPQMEQKRDQSELTFLSGNQVRVKSGGQQMTLAREGQRWRLSTAGISKKAAQAGIAPAELERDIRREALNSEAGATFQARALSEDPRIDTFTRRVAQRYLDRQLFGAPGRAASYYHAEYLDQAPFVRTTYLQFVSDPAWNRLLYGRLDSWIKEYDDVWNPGAIAVDGSGRVFVAETGRSRVLVLQIEPGREEAELRRLSVIDGLNPTDIALDDAGTPFTNSDDRLLVLDAAAGQILQIAPAGPDRHRLEGIRLNNPTAMAMGRFNGVNTAQIYIANQSGRELIRAEIDGAALRVLTRQELPRGTFVNSLKTDHFGNIYAVDLGQSRLLKFSPELQFLAAEGQESRFEGLADVDIPFGKISTADGQRYWTGFDQLFTLERWGKNSGVERRKLGLAIRQVQFALAGERQALQVELTLTDPARVTYRIFDEQNQPVYTSASQWQAAGALALSWDRRTRDNRQAAPGNYRLEVEAVSGYQDAPVTLAADFYLPLFYWQDAGSETAGTDEFARSGQPLNWGEAPGQSARRDDQAVVYHFTGLDPTGRYQLKAQAAYPEILEGKQVVSVGDENDLLRLSAGPHAAASQYRNLPAESYADGNLTVRIRNDEGGAAAVSQLWLQEIGRGLNPTPAEKNGQLPQRFVLEQNYPNPFNPSTILEFGLGNADFVTLKVYDVLGREVTTLVNERLEAGIHRVQWDGKDRRGNAVASGIYLYRLTTGAGRGLSQARKMILMR